MFGIFIHIATLPWNFAQQHSVIGLKGSLFMTGWIQWKFYGRRPTGWNICIPLELCTVISNLPTCSFPFVRILVRSGPWFRILGFARNWPRDASHFREEVEGFLVISKKKMIKNRIDAFIIWDFMFSCIFPGTEGWIAPEMLKNSGRTTYAVDVFSLGCVYYYVLSNGEHPFGDAFKRQSNISMGQHTLGHARVTECPQGAQELIQQMLSFDAPSRPPLAAIKAHPIFWSPDKILSFFLDVSDRVEKEEEGNCLVLRRLENESHLVIRHDWRDWICDEVKNDLRKYRSYKGNSVRDLLRALRNKVRLALL